MRYLLDSTLLIDHGNDDTAATKLLATLVTDGHTLYTCDVVTCETLSRGTDDELRHVQALLDDLEYVSTSPTAARWAATSRRERRARGGKQALGDALIAAVAMELGATVVTRNLQDFERQRVPTLTY